MEKFLETAKKAAKESGKIQMEYFEKEREISTKSSETDIVTQVDMLCQDAIVKIIKESFPDHNFLGEEGLEEANNSEYTWIIDPIDGTVNYTHRLPLFAVSIALKKDKDIIVGVVYVPILDEMFWAVKDQGSYLNGKKLSVSQNSTLKQSVVATGFAPDKDRNSDNNTKEFCAVTKRVRGLRRLGVACIDLAYAAAGKLDGYWEMYIKPWDIAAGVLILQEAGGKATTMDGEELQFEEKTSIIATNNNIYEELFEVLKNAEVVK